MNNEWKRMLNRRATYDVPGLLLAAAVRRMSVERHEWGAAMMAELAHLQHPLTRWQFALGCARVALFPPDKGGLLQTIMDNKAKSIIATIGVAALISLILVAPFALLELWYNTTKTSSYSHFPFPLFGLLWLLPTVSIVTAAPILRAIRARTSVLAHPVTLLLRVAFVTLTTMLWVLIIKDQLPCFLGVPNCD
jgi:hypothetical protein